MPILNYTTKIPVGRTLGEIQHTLAQAGASNITISYDRETKRPAAVVAVVGGLTYRLPARVGGVARVLERQRVESRYRTPEHAAQVAWRIVLDWLKAQLALIEAGQADFEEIMLPYMLTPSGTTVYEEWSEHRPVLLPERSQG